MFIIGFLALAVVLCSKLFHIWTGTPCTAPSRTAPTSFIALTAMVIGTQLFLSGFVAGAAGTVSHRTANDYKIDEEI